VLHGGGSDELKGFGNSSGGLVNLHRGTLHLKKGSFLFCLSFSYRNNSGGFFSENIHLKTGGGRGKREQSSLKVPGTKKNRNLKGGEG